MNIRMILLSGMLILGHPVAAAQLGDVTVQDNIVVNGVNLKLNGIGQRSKFGFVKVYVAALYTQSPRKQASSVIQPNDVKRLALVMSRNLSAQELNTALIAGLKANNSAADMGRLHAVIAQMTSIMNGIGKARKGDVVTIDFLPSELIVSFKGEKKGAIASNELHAPLLKVWLGDQPVQIDLKQALLGG